MSRVALVTGANRGLGAALAATLAERGLRVVVGARDEDAAQAVAADLPGAGAVRLEVTDPAGVAAAAAAVGPVDVLVNNAAVLPDEGTSALTVGADAVEEAVRTNLLGAWTVCRAFVPPMRERGWGRVVNVSSGAGSLAGGLWGAAPAYSVSKAALNALTLLLAAELRGTGVLVNAADPGVVATRMAPYAARTPERAAGPIADLALLPDDGPTGGFFHEGRREAW